jgi:hypothetical protein
MLGSSWLRWSSLVAAAAAAHATSCTVTPTATSCTAEPTAPAAPCTWDGPEDVVEWVRRHGGAFDARLEVREGPRGRGVFARAPIAAGETIVDVPISLVIRANDGEPCATIAALRAELAAGTCSAYWPYARSMEAVRVELPDAWSADELGLLHGLPPYDWRRHTRLYLEQCAGADETDGPGMRAMYLYVTRNGPLGMQPVFDLFNHGYNSTRHRTVDAAGGRAERHIFYTAAPHAPGDEVFNSFFGPMGAGHGRAAVAEAVATIGRGRSAAAIDRALHARAGAPETFRDYGFVDGAPTLWWFHPPGGGRDADAVEHVFVSEDGGGVYWPRGDVDRRQLAADARAFLDEQRWRAVLPDGPSGARAIRPEVARLAHEYRPHANANRIIGPQAIAHELSFQNRRPKMRLRCMMRSPVF